MAYPLWFNPSRPLEWPNISISVLPSLMGFSIAGMTVLLAFSHPRSLSAITKSDESKSYFVKTFANMFHFLVVQATSLLLAVFGKAVDHVLLSYLGVLTLVYAILASLAVAGQLLNTARIINKAAAPKSDS